MKANKLSARLMTAFIAAAAVIGITAFVSVRAVRGLEGYCAECSESYAARAAEVYAARDNILGAERDILAALSSSDGSAAEEYISAARSGLNALEDSLINDGEDIWSSAAPVEELIAASQVRDAVFGSVSSGNMKIARNVFFSEYQPKLLAAAEYTDSLLAELSAEGEDASAQISARASKYARVCVGIGLLGISAVTFIALFIDKRLRENAVEEPVDEAVPEDKYELVSPEAEEDERLAEAEETISNAVNCLNILADGDPDAAADGEYPYRYENVLSAIRKMKARLRFIGAQINRAAEFVSAESVRVSDNAEELSAAALEQETTAEQLSDSFARISELIGQSRVSSEDMGSLGAKSGRLMEDCARELNNAENSLEMLRKSAEEMEGLAKAAADIASHANMLAVSAAMNAAKGECSGRSLAELADEARSLALRSAEASSEAAEIVKRCGERIGSGAAAVCAASASASEVFGQTKDMSGRAEALEELCEKQSEALSAAKECMDKISGFVLLSKNASEEYAASGRMLSEQSGALKKIVPGHSETAAGTSGETK
ncbi:MAG: methyl-accepting chemotaxis protein [Huintestinicola sp.]|uniref:methyl-accepting chemotaxis protein n=1 Tax=Huintestinicola sp. TaxID=2981661 RepID=UPI003F0C58CA